MPVRVGDGDGVKAVGGFRLLLWHMRRPCVRPPTCSYGLPRQRVLHHLHCVNGSHTGVAEPRFGKSLGGRRACGASAGCAGAAAGCVPLSSIPCCSKAPLSPLAGLSARSGWFADSAPWKLCCEETRLPDFSMVKPQVVLSELRPRPVERAGVGCESTHVTRRARFRGAFAKPHSSTSQERTC